MEKFLPPASQGLKAGVARSKPPRLRGLWIKDKSVTGWEGAGDATPLLHVKLQTLQRLARAGSNTTGLSELERRLITLIGAYKAATSVRLVAFLGLGKAQISHAIKSLHDAGLIERPALRAQISLSSQGQDMFRQIMDGIIRRNRELAAGLDAATQHQFLASTIQLTDRAALMFAQEQALAEGKGSDIPRRLADPPSQRVQAGLADDQMSPLLLPTLSALASYLKRCRSLIYKREADLSSFDWQVLSQIADMKPAMLAQLVADTTRDKAQVGRTVQALAERGLITRDQARGRREVSLDMTDIGNGLCRLVRYADSRFDAYLFEEFSLSNRRKYLGVVDRLIKNAERLSHP